MAAVPDSAVRESRRGEDPSRRVGAEASLLWRGLQPLLQPRDLLHTRVPEGKSKAFVRMIDLQSSAACWRGTFDVASSLQSIFGKVTNTQGQETLGPKVLCVHWDQRRGAAGVKMLIFKP